MPHFPMPSIRDVPPPVVREARVLTPNAFNYFCVQRAIQFNTRSDLSQRLEETSFHVFLAFSFAHFCILFLSLQFLSLPFFLEVRS